MRCIWQTVVLLLVSSASAGGQSLAEAARRESERRKALEEAGVEAKSLVNETLPRKSNGSLTTGTPGGASGDRRTVRTRPERRSSPAPYRAALKRLDGDILKCEEQLTFSRQKYELERNSFKLSTKVTRTQNADVARERLLLRIQELEARLKRLRQERRETYDSGRRAGFHPGELDGHARDP